MLGAWRKIENENGFPYYYNEAMKMRQWDHPKFVDIRQRIDDCNYVKHAKYRIAMKFRVLQHALYLEDISLATIIGVFDKHQLGVNESGLCLESCDLEAVLSDVYFAANKQNHSNIDVDYATELTQTFLYNVFDKERRGNIQVSGTKLILAILCHCSITDVYHMLFKLCSDHNGCVTRMRLQTLLTKFVDISVFLHEDVTFGQHLVNPTVENCFSASPGLVGIAENQFLNWLESGPYLIAWIPILRRLKNSETGVHSGKCTTCKTTPLVGLRYRCTKCARFTQCQQCFLIGRIANTHKLSHPMREYSIPDSTTQSGSSSSSAIVPSNNALSRDLSLHSLVKKLCSLLPCNILRSTANHTLAGPKDAQVSPSNYTEDNASDVTNNIESSDPTNRLQSIIKQLERQNRQLNQVLLLGSHRESDIRHYLEEHRAQIESQIIQLKAFKQQLLLTGHINQLGNSSDEQLRHMHPMVESTPSKPHENGRNRHHSLYSMNLFSPITEEASQVTKHTKSYAPSAVEHQAVFNSGLSGQLSGQYTMNDVSTWMATKSCGEIGVGNNNYDVTAMLDTPVSQFHNELDDALAKLQQILANNFPLESDPLTTDNNNLKQAVDEVEGMLTSIIDNVESCRTTNSI